MSSSAPPDARAKPPESLRLLFKHWRAQDLEAIESSPDVIDTKFPDPAKVTVLEVASREVENARALVDTTTNPHDVSAESQAPFEVKGLPGLIVFPSILSLSLQVVLLDKLLHRDLSNSLHKTNLHLHHQICYPRTFDDCPASFFGAPQDNTINPHDPTVHKPISLQQMLESKLRWLTLGGQYDWTNKVYPEEAPPPFPDDITQLLRSFFPSINAQAAIVNLYSPGDTLSVHRDVSEQCRKDLVSISVGCDGLFVVGNDDGSHVATIRLRSGDAVLMSGEARYAWHGVPKILAGTCADRLSSWPATSSSGPYEQWRGWMSRKRVNLNVRQMFD